MATWIFNGNPNLVPNLIGEIEVRPEWNWDVTHHKRDVKEGDRAYIWVSGSDAGIIASGEVISDPQKRDGKYLESDLKFDHKFTGKRILKATLLGDERTKKLSIIRKPRGQANYRVTEEEAEVIEHMIDGTYGESYPRKPAIEATPYFEKDFLEEVYMNKEDYDKLLGLIDRKKNVILQGPPGVGKTFVARRLVFSIMGKKDTNRVQMVQFHQNYSYEDFIMGFRPTDKGGFRPVEGSFYDFCMRAKEDSGNDYFFIIDEINRGNLSKIFGELLMLIENDKRGEEHELPLLYKKDEKFFVPENIRIIGMMNTADRSLAMIDYALRRRFAFFEMKPAFDSNGFGNLQKEIGTPKFKALVSKVKELNTAIGNDKSLGDGFCIGHSYFCPEKDIKVDDNWLRSVINYELVPLLNEYWFDNKEEVKKWKEKLLAVVEGKVPDGEVAD